jgi:prepilin-type N-terminal cleavage/methylation domain-containing protein
MKDSRNSARIARNDRGFTILEVVVAMIIISILTLVMMPTITNRSNQARMTAAQHDMQALAEAESRASIDMNYYVVPWRLNNVIGSPVARQNTGNTTQALDPYTNYNDMFINTITLDIPGNVNQIHDSFVDNETDFGWRGPYVNFRRFDEQVNWPQDPWGNEYILFTKAGILFAPDPGEAALQVEFETSGPTYTDIDGNPAPAINNIDGVFDRPTWISLGPNGLPGDGSTPVNDETDFGFYGNGDDLVLSFEGFDGSTGP